MKLAVLVSGRGSNLEAILAAERAAALGPASVCCVISNRPAVRALDVAAAAGKPAITIDHKNFASREAFEDALLATLAEHGAQAVALAGFMRLVTPRLLDAFPLRVVNIHPSLLPAFPGAHAHRDALAHGVRITGATVHFVSAGTDEGPIITQAPVPVLPGDSEATLAARVLQAEHRIYPRALRWLAEGRLSLDGRLVRLSPPPVGRALGDRYAELHGPSPVAALAEARAVGQVARARGNGVAVVSACLIGERCRYDGADKRDDGLIGRLTDAGLEVLPICPEVLAGFGVPRPAMELSGDGVRVVATGEDVTGAMRAGARRAAELAKAAGAVRAILKQRSPACATAEVHKDGLLVPGRGLAAEELAALGLHPEDELGR